MILPKYLPKEDWKSVKTTKLDEKLTKPYQKDQNWAEIDLMP